MKMIPLKEALSKVHTEDDATVSAQELVSYFDRMSRRKYLGAQAAALLVFGTIILGFNLKYLLVEFTILQGLLVLVVGLGFPLAYWRQTRVVLKMPISERFKRTAMIKVQLVIFAVGCGLLGSLALLSRLGLLQVPPWRGTGIRNYLPWLGIATVPLSALLIQWAAGKLAKFFDPYHLE